MSEPQRPFCKDEDQRRALVLTTPGLNGIDFVEVDPADHTTLRIFFLKPIIPADVAGLSKITISGGTRIVGIRVLDVKFKAPGFLEIKVNQGGDYSVYTLTIDATALDPVLRSVPLNFMATCPVDFDCRRVTECPPGTLVEPLLDYLAKDYSSFRRMLIDLLPQLNPKWVERNPSDAGMALLELLAYTGDYLSYFQDAVANEAYLDTLRQRISARRHARLIDYRMHDGRNAWAGIHVAVKQDCDLPMGTKVVSRIVAPLAGDTTPPGVFLDEAKIDADALDKDPAVVSAVVFETTHPARLSVVNNEIRLHTWGNLECCLAPGTTEAYLYSVSGNQAVRPVLRKGDSLLLEEVRGPLTGAAADADPAHRQVVLVDEDPQGTTDDLFQDTLLNGQLQPRGGGQPLPLVRVHWWREDSLRFALCLSARRPQTGLLREISVARGNIVLADHGLTLHETLAQPAPVPSDAAFRLRLRRGPLTMQCEPDSMEFDPVAEKPDTPRTNLGCDVPLARPAVFLLIDFPTGRELWTAVPDLLDSPPFDKKFVAEVDNDGNAILRFGDGEYGREVAGASSFRAIYRIGNGRRGNVGAESLVHLALPKVSPLRSQIASLRNPLPAQAGVDPETIEEVRQLAPMAFRAVQFRAVTEADYAAAARKMPQVSGAVANFRWTGSWYTVFVGVDPRESSDLIQLPNGRTRLASAFERTVRNFLTRYKLAGYDMEIRPPTFVPLQIDLSVCALPGYFRGDVGQAVARALREFFGPGNFTFGQPVYLSRLYDAVERVEGVDSAVVTTFRRYRQADNGELAKGVIPIGPWEIAQLENDPNFMEHGVLRITAKGGKL